MISFQTNVDSLIAQQNLNINSAFQSNTIQQLTSGYRINSSGDDAAGLATANADRDQIAQITQGVANGNNGTAQLQIMDGGMSNISQILDRLQTLATEASSSTFGTRTAVNQEFQNDIGELNRQAQAIGLNTGGTYANMLDVYMGGGGGANSAAVSQNAQVQVDLSKSTVDAQSLGLSGMQVVAGTNGVTDIGGGHAATSVSAILAPAASNALSAPNTTDFVFAGSGFSDASAVKVAVNTQGVTDINTLVTAINAGIQAAGNGSSPAATAFQNANIVASVHTDDATGDQTLAFTSSTSAFQVAAGDQTANALMGNFNTGATGKTIATTLGVTTAAQGTGLSNPTNVSVRIGGAGMSSPVTLTLSSADANVDNAITDLENQITNSATLGAAGITLTGNSTSGLTFHNANGGAFSVEVTGDTANVLGMGTFVGGLNHATDYSTISGASAYSYTAAGSTGTQTLQFSLNGGASNSNAVTVNLQNTGGVGGATAATQETGSAAAYTLVAADAAANALEINGVGVTGLTTGMTLAQVAGQINQQSAGLGATATLDASGNLWISSTAVGPAAPLAITGAAAAGGHLDITGSPFAGTAATETNVLNQLNQQFAANPTLQKAGLVAQDASVTGGTAGAIQIVSSNGTYFRLNTAAITGGSAGIGFGTAGATFTSSLAAAASSNLAVQDAQGTSYTQGIAFTPMAYGNDTQALTISANDSTGSLQTRTITLANNGANRSGESIDEAISAINLSLQSSNNATMQSIVAVKDNSSGTQKIDFISNLSSFSVGVGSSVNTNGLAAGLAQTVTSQANGSAANVSIDSLSGAQAAVTAITAAVASLGNAQAAIGKGENQLNYAVNLAQSQITNISAAESQIRDANVAQQAANMTKASVLQQATIAAMAQANQEPQAVLSLLKQ